MAVGVVKLGLAGHSIVLGAGNVEMLGADVSRTVMVWDAVLLLLQGSVALQVRVTE